MILLISKNKAIRDRLSTCHKPAAEPDRLVESIIFNATYLALRTVPRRQAVLLVQRGEGDQR